MQDVFHLVREFFRVKGFEADQGFLFRSLDIFPSPSDVDDTDLRIEGAGAGGHLETIGAGAKVDIGHENREAVWLGLDEALERLLARMSREDFDSVVAKRPFHAVGDDDLVLNKQYIVHVLGPFRPKTHGQKLKFHAS